MANAPEARTLSMERQRVLDTITTTDAEYKAKWDRVNELTLQIALANGSTRKEMAEYGKRKQG